MMFSEEFAGLPVNVQMALRQRLEEVIRLVYNRSNTSNRDHSVQNYTKEEISGMISSVFDLAERLKSSDIN